MKHAPKPEELADANPQEHEWQDNPQTADAWLSSAADESFRKRAAPITDNTAAKPVEFEQAEDSQHRPRDGNRKPIGECRHGSLAR